MTQQTEWEREQIEYYKLLAKKEEIDIEIKAHKKILNYSFKKENKKKIMLIDTLFVLFILFNIGALLITNALVMKNPNKTIKEANPITSKTHNLESTNNLPQYFGIIFHIIILTIMITYYTLLRNNIKTNKEYTTYLTVIIILGTFLTYDFLNDLGYYIGKIIFR